MRIISMLLLWAACGVAADSPVGSDILIPAGEFTMGRVRDRTDDTSRMRPLVTLDDRPAHKVWLDAYRMDTTEVTNRQYAEFTKSTGHRKPHHWQGGNYPNGQDLLPVFNVSWDDANSYCGWAGKRLPTEAEWERAAKAGQDDLTYPWGDKIDTKNVRFDVESGPGAVAQFQPNGLGLFDIIGNVSEWCFDWFDREYYKASEYRNPRGPSTGSYKVIRGGAWSDGPPRLTIVFRNWVRPSQRTANIGFRCVKTGEN